MKKKKNPISLPLLVSVSAIPNFHSLLQKISLLLNLIFLYSNRSYFNSFIPSSIELVNLQSSLPSTSCIDPSNRLPFSLLQSISETRIHLLMNSRRTKTEILPSRNPFVAEAIHKSFRPEL
jgi:hypothetical protein